jgi:hypothetical protein
MSEKYGLILNTKKKIVKLDQGNWDEEDEGENNTAKDYKNTINRNLLKQQEYNKNLLTTDMVKNLSEDPNVYEYDSLYDNISSVKNSKKKIEEDKNKPKYIHNILANAERVKLERQIALEKIEKKRREREGEVEDKPKFITKGYEEQLAINNKKQMLMKLDEKYDEKNSVLNKETGMMGFYSNLLTKNTAYGGGKRGEGDVEQIAQNTKKKKDFKAEIEEKLDRREKQIKEPKPPKSEVIKPEEKPKEPIEEAKAEENANAADQQAKAEEYKKRYLERKRYRDDNK